MEKYKEIKKLGDGAFGSVTKCQNTENGEIIAVKKMKQKFLSWDECIQLRELQALRKLIHPNIIKLKEVVRVNEELSFIFEYIEKNIYTFCEDYKKKGEQLTEETIKSIAFQIISSISYMHKNGFFHRDLKPENVLISNTGIVKLIDFGLARQIRARPPFTDYVSTRWYRAPEIILRSTQYNSPVDIFAYGCILGELYLMKPMFQGNSELDQLSKERPSATKILSHPFFNDINNYLPAELLTLNQNIQNDEKKDLFQDNQTDFGKSVQKLPPKPGQQQQLQQQQPQYQQIQQQQQQQQQMPFPNTKVRPSNPSQTDILKTLQQPQQQHQIKHHSSQKQIDPIYQFLNEDHKKMSQNTNKIQINQHQGGGLHSNSLDHCKGKEDLILGGSGFNNNNNNQFQTSQKSRPISPSQQQQQQQFQQQDLYQNSFQKSPLNRNFFENNSKNSQQQVEETSYIPSTMIQGNQNQKVQKQQDNKKEYDIYNFNNVQSNQQNSYVPSFASNQQQNQSDNLYNFENIQMPQRNKRI